LHRALHLFKRQFVLEALARCEGNRSRAAAALMIERTSLLRLIRELGITEVPSGQRGRPASPRKPA
jgi:DNA-binding NtrC family response regulator